MVLQLALYCLECGEREGEVTAGALQCQVYSKAREHSAVPGRAGPDHHPLRPAQGVAGPAGVVAGPGHRDAGAAVAGVRRVYRAGARTVGKGKNRTEARRWPRTGARARRGTRTGARIVAGARQPDDRGSRVPCSPAGEPRLQHPALQPDLHLRPVWTVNTNFRRIFNQNQLCSAGFGRSSSLLSDDMAMSAEFCN